MKPNAAMIIPALRIIEMAFCRIFLITWSKNSVFGMGFDSVELFYTSNLMQNQWIFARDTVIYLNLSSLLITQLRYINRFLDDLRSRGTLHEGIELENGRNPCVNFLYLLFSLLCI